MGYVELFPLVLCIIGDSGEDKPGIASCDAVAPHFIGSAVGIRILQPLFNALQPLRDAIVQLPVVKNLIATIQRLEHEVGEWRKRCRKAEREKEALQKENAELKAEKAVADRVMQTKLNLSPQVIDIMKSQAAQEIAREQQDKDDDVLGW